MEDTEHISKNGKLLFDQSEWTFEIMERTYHAIADIAHNHLQLDTYVNQVEVISSEQMLDAYSSIGLPLLYPHWSFGKHYLQDEALYRKGMRGLAYEIVINSNPCISYNMEENSMAMQTLVMAHAAFGHNHFFKNNYLFRQWTDADAILDYLNFAKGYIEKCEERYGQELVEATLDAAHALMDQGVFRYARKPKLSRDQMRERQREREQYEEQFYGNIWSTVPMPARDEAEDDDERRERARRQELYLPEENILYFLEKNSPVLQGWQREILRIVRTIAQYFYPQKQTKVMNEGCATFVHYTICNKLFEDGLISEGALMEILHSHTNVVAQPEFDSPYFSGINPYALGFAMMQDIQRICINPTDEDREWFPDFAGNPDWQSVLKDAWANYRDESFILQYLSPNLMRKFRFFHISDDHKNDYLAVADIHNRRGYREIRSALSRQYDISTQEPDIQVVDADLKGDRELHLRHTVFRGILLDEKRRNAVMDYVSFLWGYGVTLHGCDYETGSEIYLYQTEREPAST